MAIRAITITDRATGASVRLPSTDVPQATVDDLWRAAGEIFGIARGEVGRPSERDVRIDAYRTAITALRDAGRDETQIHARTVLNYLSRTGDDSQLGDDVKPHGGWRAFRAKVYRGE